MYASDNGERDNPTCWHFEKNRPVTKVIEVKMGQHVRLLNREGRAICRIIHAQGRPAVQIATIFGISQNAIARAIANSYTPPDDASADYDHVDPEFKVKYPPPQRAQRAQAPPTYIQILDSEDEEDTKAGILSAETDRPRGGNAAATTSANGRPTRTAKTQCLARMQNSEELDESKGRLNHAHGAGVSAASAVNSGLHKRLTPSQLVPKNTNIVDIRQAVTSRTPAPQPSSSTSTSLHTRQKRPHDAEGAPTTPKYPSSTPESTSASLTKKPRYTPPPDYAPAYPHNARSANPLPPPNSAIQSPPVRQPSLPKPPALRPSPALPLPRAALLARNAELDAFLANVAGADLSGYRALFVAQGFDITMLRVVAKWKREDVDRALRELLQDGGTGLDGRRGLSSAQVFGLKLAIEQLSN
ncbi:hypothetical protein B0H17DRAFT_1093715 [Mycena rosella]|uniref:Uncharacterized protein n=1 Tax=Mycena rosella TaxID=1033263 RepID=A0AAD7G5Q5_MYCRO|nr:hypothetical protein B0H17DRAFT_1093715 [Mycena rosella]